VSLGSDPGCFTVWQNNPLYPLQRRFDRLQSRSRCYGEKSRSFPGT